ncbi:TPA: hypothetical protein ACXJLS_000362 [Stenotrophomonas maltophilia]
MTTSVESNDFISSPKQHRWNDVGERCLDCGDKDWMNDPICRPRCADPETTAPPDIRVSPSSVLINAIPVDALAILDIEIDAITLQVKRGSAPQHTLHDMVATRVAVAELIEAASQVSEAAVKHYGNCMGLHLALTGIGGLNERLAAALARVKGV